MSNAAISFTSVRLADGAEGRTDKPDAPVWVQIATEGTYKGYQGGAVEFTFDAALFNKVIANFHASPSYDGKSGVVAWDFNHSSELPANSGSLPALGSPAQGWILDLKTMRGADGKATLWALTQWGSLARDYIKAGQYRWASVSIVFDAVDAVSGKRIGPVLTSVAMTNQPFIEGMQPLAASRFGTSTQQTKGNSNMKEQIFKRARELLAAGERTNVMALSKAAAELCPRLSHNERFLQFVLPMNAENNLQTVAHAVRNGATLARAPRQPVQTAAIATKPNNDASDTRPVIDCSVQYGPTPFAKLLAHVKGTSPHLSHDAATEHAMRLNKSHRVVA